MWHKVSLFVYIDQFFAIESSFIVRFTENWFPFSMIALFIVSVYWAESHETINQMCQSICNSAQSSGMVDVEPSCFELASSWWFTSFKFRLCQLLYLTTFCNLWSGEHGSTSNSQKSNRPVPSWNKLSRANLRMKARKLSRHSSCDNGSVRLRRFIYWWKAKSDKYGKRRNTMHLKGVNSRQSTEKIINFSASIFVN